MRNQVVWLTVFILIGFFGFDSSNAQEGVNLLENGGFEEGPAMPFNTWAPLTWSIYAGDTGANGEVVSELTDAAVPEDPIEGDYCLHIVVPIAGVDFWDAGLEHTGHIFETGKSYTLSAFLKCKEGTLDVNFKPEHSAGSYEGYGEQVITITDQWVEYRVTTPVFTADVSPANMTFHIGFAPAEFWVDNVRFYEGDYIPPQ